MSVLVKKSITKIYPMAGVTVVLYTAQSAVAASVLVIRIVGFPQAKTLG